MKDKFKSFTKPILALTAVVVISLSVLTFSSQTEVKAQEGCVIGDFTIQTDLLCWATEAANWAVNNQLFSILDAKDLRDAVKHYRFYQLVMSELQ
jgi:hypothetical protein